MPVFATETPDDLSPLRDAAGASDDGFLRLVHAYDQMVLRFAMRVTGSSEEARRIYLDVFLKLRRAVAGVRPADLRLWIYRAAAQACLEHVPRRSASRSSLAAVADPLVRVIESLTPHERLVFELRRYERLDFDEVGHALNATPAAVKSMFVRTMGRLRNALDSNSETLTK
jgi:DNA-directed RNA polymerase specialized sigma24 family protein